MKGLIEVEFVKVGQTDFKLVENDVNVQKEFKKNWEKITVLMTKMLEDFYKRYKIKIKISSRIDVTPRKE
jgi:hypothetical protein